MQEALRSLRKELMPALAQPEPRTKGGDYPGYVVLGLRDRLPSLGTFDGLHMRLRAKEHTVMGRQS